MYYKVGEEMYDKAQLMRGTLEGCILRLLLKKPAYGYDIVTQLENYGFEEMKEGTIYPMLVRLEKKGFISAEFRPSPLGPSRKYYHTTESGTEYLEEFSTCWNQVVSAMQKIFGEEENDETEASK